VLRAVPPIEARDFTFRLAIDGPLLQIRPFIVGDFSLRDTDLGFQPSVFPVEAENHEGAAGDRAQSIKFVDLLTVKEKFSHAFRGGNFVARAFVRLNVGIVKKGLTFLDPNEGVGNVRLAGADRFYFTAFELDAGFVALENVKIAERFAVEDRLGRHRLEDNTGGTPVGRTAETAVLRDAALRSSAVGGRLRGELVGELAGDDFAQRDVGEGGTRSGFDKRTMA